MNDTLAAGVEQLLKEQNGFATVTVKDGTIIVITADCLARLLIRANETDGRVVVFAKKAEVV